MVDLGCGTGYSAGYFVKKGMKVEGVDLSSGMIRIAQRNYPNILFFNQDMREFEPEKPVNAVWAGYSLFHLEQMDFEKTLDKIRMYLKSGGFFGLVMQEGEGELEVDEPLLPGEKIYVHLYQEDELKEILEKHGFKTIEIKRKKVLYEMEFPFEKLLFIVQ
ncbi:MAG: class I SAM-dependent methyltransferase [Patescibacteria group bacterium]